MFAPNLDQHIMKNRAAATARARFFENRPSTLTLIFDPILVPTWLYFGTQNPPKSTQKSIPRGIQKMIDFRIDFLPKLAPFWDPSWDPRAAQDGPKTPPKTLPRRHQDSPRATRAPKIEIWSIFGPKVRWGTPPASIFDVFSTFKLKFWCQSCARELGKFYIRF